MSGWVWSLPESRTSTIARLLGVLVDRSSADRASRLIRGRVAMLIEDIVVAIVLVEGTDSGGRKSNKSKIEKE